MSSEFEDALIKKVMQSNQYAVKKAQAIKDGNASFTVGNYRFEITTKRGVQPYE